MKDLSIDFTTSQLNDVLKSLTAVDLGDGRVSSVRYNSIAPLDERLKSLRLPFGEQVTQAEYLTALRGARVEVHSGSATATGRLLSVEKSRKQRAHDEFEDVTIFSIVTDTGEMRNFDLAGASVRIVERELTRRGGPVSQPHRRLPRSRRSPHEPDRIGIGGSRYFRELHQ